MDKGLTSAAGTTGSKTWKSMNQTDRIKFLAKVCVMVLSCGFIYGNALVE